MSGQLGGLPRASLVPNMRGEPWVDQVPRKTAFQEAHPEVAITLERDPVLSVRWWQAAILAGTTVEYVIKRELGDLLDTLEERFMNGPGG